MRLAARAVDGQIVVCDNITVVVRLDAAALTTHHGVGREIQKFLTKKAAALHL